MSFFGGLLGGAVGALAGGPAGAKLGYSLGSQSGSGSNRSIMNTMQQRAQQSAQQAGSQQSEYDDLARRRAQALSDAAQPARLPGLVNDPSQQVNYSAPAVAARNTSLFDRAVGMQRPENKITNDALDTLQHQGQFTYGDRPAAQMNNDPLDEIRNFQGTAGSAASQMATQGYHGSATGGRSMLADAMNGPGVSAQSVNNMDERANVSELMAFDPSASFEKYSEGAQGKLNTALDQSNLKLTNSAAGGNRLNTGFFNKDSGELSRQIQGDYRNDVMSHALDTNQQKLSAITSGSTIRANDLDALRGQYLDAQKANAGNSLQASMANADNKYRGAGMAIDDDNNINNRDLNARQYGVGQMGAADDRRLAALNNARGYMEDDRARVDTNYNNDRTAAQSSFNNYGDRLSDIAKTQRADQSRLDTQFGDDRDFLMKGQNTSDSNYNNDRDYNLDAWGRENDTKFKGGDVARSDRDFTYKGQQDQQNRYLDLLNGNSDRAQGQRNADQQRQANSQSSSNDMWGKIAGTASGLLGSYLNRGKSGTSASASMGRTGFGTNFGKNLSLGSSGKYAQGGHDDELNY